MRRGLQRAPWSLQRGAVRSGLGTWSNTGTLNCTQLHTATLLLNGKVLVAAGLGVNYLVQRGVVSCGLGTWTYDRLHDHGARLSHGDVAAQWQGAGRGGSSGVVILPARSCMLRQVEHGRRPASLGTARDYHTAILLPSGKVLVAGGESSGFLEQRRGVRSRPRL